MLRLCMAVMGVLALAVPARAQNDVKSATLDAVKKRWKGRVTTVFPRQGHFAHDDAALKADLAAATGPRRVGLDRRCRLGASPGPRPFRPWS